MRALVTAGMFLAGVIGFAQVYRPVSAVEWTDTLFRTAQLVVGEFPQELLPAPGAPRLPVPLILEIARFGLPLLVLWLALTGLVRRIRMPLRAAGAGRLSGHLVLAGRGDAIERLCAEAANRRTLVIAAPGADAARATGTVVIPGDPTSPETWRDLGLARAAAVAVVGMEDAEALATTLAAAEAAGEERPAEAPPLPLTVSIEDADLRALLDSLFRGRDPRAGVILSATSPARLRARALLARHPLHRGVDVAGGEAVHVLVIGFGRLGQEIAVEVLKTGMVAEDRLPRITVVDPAAARLSRAFGERYGNVETLRQIAFVSEAVDPGDGAGLAALCERIGPVGAIYLCLPDETMGLLVAIALRRWAAAQGCGAPPIYLRAPGAAALGRHLAQASLGEADLTRIHVFGHDEASTLDALTGETLDRRARQIHERYLGQVASPAASFPSQRPWALLPEIYRQANRDQADYLPMRLAALGLAVVPAAEGGPVPEALIEPAARTEHARWQAAASLAGWRLGPRDNLALRHPDLVPFDALDEAGREKDRGAVRGIVDQLGADAGLAPVRVVGIDALSDPVSAATLVESDLPSPAAARALRAAAGAHPHLRWRLRLAPATIPALWRWDDDAARGDALWLIEHAEQVLWTRTANVSAAHRAGEQAG